VQAVLIRNAMVNIKIQLSFARNSTTVSKKIALQQQQSLTKTYSFRSEGFSPTAFNPQHFVQPQNNHIFKQPPGLDRNRVQ
jgi:hypothetical protein